MNETESPAEESYMNKIQDPMVKDLLSHIRDEELVEWLHNQIAKELNMMHNDVVDSVKRMIPYEKIWDKEKSRRMIEDTDKTLNKIKDMVLPGNVFSSHYDQPYSPWGPHSANATKTHVVTKFLQDKGAK